MDLNAIALFVKVVDAGSFAAASRVAGVPKSTIARRIDELERSLGVRLLQRSPRHSRPTEAGQAFYERGRRIVRDVEEATASVSEHQAEPQGRLRLTASVLMAETFLGAWAIEYLERHPQVDLDLFLSTKKVDLIADGFDLAIRVGPLEPSSHIVRKLAPAPAYLCASPEYLEAHPPITHPEDLRAHEAVLFCPDRVPAPWTLQSDAGGDVSVAVTGRVMVNSLPVALQACLQGTGVALLPALVSCHALRSGELVRVLPEWANRRSYMHALFPSRRNLSATVRTFLDFIGEKMDPPPWVVDGEP